jgi:uncharacterized protein YjbI with pentapeptide repeats
MTPAVNGRYNWEQVLTQASALGRYVVTDKQRAEGLAAAQEAQSAWDTERPLNEDAKKRLLGLADAWLKKNCPTDWASRPQGASSATGIDFATADAQLKSGTPKAFDWRGLDLSDANLRGAELPGLDASATMERACPSTPDKPLPFKGSLRRANLTGALLTSAKLAGADMPSLMAIGALFYDADAKGANLYDADLRYAVLDGADLTGADLRGADLSGASLNETNLTNANLAGAKLVGADLTDTNIQDANLDAVDFSGATYNATGTPRSVRGAINLKFLSQKSSSAAMIALRKKLTDTGFETNAREVTYALQTQQTGLLLAGGNPDVHLWPWVQWAIGVGYFILFQWTSEWSLDVTKPLVILAVLIPVFAFPYAFALNRRRLIWRMVPKTAIGSTGSDAWEQVWKRGRSFPAKYRIALWFSLLMAFRVGFQQFTIGEWISRIHPKEEVLAARGWARVIAGIQSLISFYLLALAILCIFGRPFG